MHFHPDVEIPILAFDPTVIQDSFDPFDLADYINMEVERGAEGKEGNIEEE